MRIPLARPAHPGVPASVSHPPWLKGTGSGPRVRTDCGNGARWCKCVQTRVTANSHIPVCCHKPIAIQRPGIHVFLVSRVKRSSLCPGLFRRCHDNLWRLRCARVHPKGWGGVRMSSHCYAAKRPLPPDFRAAGQPKHGKNSTWVSAHGQAPRLLCGSQYSALPELGVSPPQPLQRVSLPVACR